MIYPGGGYPGLYFPARRVSVGVLPEYVDFDVRICREFEGDVMVEREIIECDAQIDRTLEIVVSILQTAPNTIEADVNLVREAAFRVSVLSALTLAVEVDR